MSAEQLEEISEELKYCANISADLDAHMQRIREQVYREGNPKKYEEMSFHIPSMPVVPTIPPLSDLQAMARTSLAGRKRKITKKDSAKIRMCAMISIQ